MRHFFWFLALITYLHGGGRSQESEAVLFMALAAEVIIWAVEELKK